ncbi:MAG: enediyne biosynthesis protein UnbU [Myxococcota bacterium]
MSKPRNPRVGNRTAAVLATLLTVLGHTFLGFEQPWAHVFVALATGYTCALGFEWVDARANGRPAGFAGGWRPLADFLVSPHMTSITTSFLIYPNGRFEVLAFCVALAIGSKFLFRVPGPNGRYVHFFNPSNFGIAVTLFLFPWVSVIPYAFLEWTHGPVDAIVPLVILALGTRLNLLFTKRIPLILTWCGAFAAQALIRSVWFDTPLLAGLSPMTGVTFVLFSFYMITDPMTSPASVRGQVGFGVALAAAYAALMVEHVIFTLFYAVFLVTGLRGAWMYAEHLLAVRSPSQQPAPAGGK